MTGPESTASGRPDRTSTRYDLLDVCRGVACLAVVVHHAGFCIAFNSDFAPGVEGWLRWFLVGAIWRMNLGVPIFFVISGYCIGASADAARRRGGGALSFLRRRFRRIYPPYWGALLVFAAVTAGLDLLGLTRLYHSVGAQAIHLDSPGELGPAQWLGNLTLTEQWRPLVWQPPDRSVYTRVAWSLCYEEQFYFVCFLMLLVAPRRLYRAWAVGTALILGYRAICLDLGWVGSFDGTFVLLWHEFAIGLAVYWALNGTSSTRARWALGFALGLLAASGFSNGRGSTPVLYSTPTAAVFGLLLLALRRWDEGAKSLAWLAPLRACGRRSYSIYLVHLPVCTVANLSLVACGLTSFWVWALVMIPLVSCTAVGAGWAFYHHVERHFLGVPRPAPVPSGGVVGILRSTDRSRPIMNWAPGSPGPPPGAGAA